MTTEKDKEKDNKIENWTNKKTVSHGEAIIGLLKTVIEKYSNDLKKENTKEQFIAFVTLGCLSEYVLGHLHKDVEKMIKLISENVSKPEH